MTSIEVCLSIALFKNFDVQGKNVVVIDVLRATSAICAAFGSGAAAVYTTDIYDEALRLQQKGFLAAGERDGIICPGFDFGNSPLQFTKTSLLGKELVFFTTNGTKAIEMIPAQAGNILIACMNNLSNVVDFLIEQKIPVLIFCAGWKGQPSLEDTFCAGAISIALENSGNFQLQNDSAVMSKILWQHNKDKAEELFIQSEHGQRLARLGFEDDVRFCSLIDISNVLPLKQDSYFCNKSHQL